jgi:sister-chromatid-cohesion protein PDS5
MALKVFVHTFFRDVQLLVACCIADILRIFAPEAPYKTAEQIKTIFYFLIKQLGGLRDPKDPAFKRHVYRFFFGGGGAIALFLFFKA